MTLDEYLESRSSSEKQRVESALASFPSAPQVAAGIVRNLGRESRLSEEAWQDITGAITQASTNARSLANAYEDACRKHILSGGAIPDPPLRLGRAINEVGFCCNVLLKSGEATSERRAKQYVRNLLAKQPAVQRKRLASLPLGRSPMWATFSPKQPAGDPFAGLPSDADGIRAHLGLYMKDRGKDLLLFIYELPTGEDPMFPTVADAGWQWSRHFRPAPQGSPWGLAVPWRGIVGDEEEPRPEVVHEAVTGNALAEQLRLIRAKRG